MLVLGNQSCINRILEKILNIKPSSDEIENCFSKWFSASIKGRVIVNRWRGYNFLIFPIVNFRDGIIPELILLV